MSLKDKKALVSAIYPKGTRIKLVMTTDPYTHLKPGDKGTVDFIDDACQIHIRWDNHSSIAMIPGEDIIAKVEDSD